MTQVTASSPGRPPGVGQSAGTYTVTRTGLITAPATEHTAAVRTRSASRIERELAVAEWLLISAVDLNEAVADWRSTGVAVMRCGGVLAALRLPGRLVHAAAGADEPSAVASYLADALQGGPVIVSSNGDQYYALVPPSAAELRLPPDVECLGRSWLFYVPRPDLNDPAQHARSSYWAVPMDGPGSLCQPEAVVQVAAAGYRQMSTEGAEQ